MSNFSHIIGNSYTAENQNGFNQAIYHFFGFHQTDTNGEFSWSGYKKKDIRKMLQNYPKSYPCTFSITDQSFECGRIWIEIVPNEILEKIYESLHTIIK